MIKKKGRPSKDYQISEKDNAARLRYIIDTKKREHRRRLIDSFVNAVYLYDDRMIITFNYKDGLKTITLAELEKSALGSDINVPAPPNEKP